jgi:hypothetical protein
MAIRNYKMFNVQWNALLAISDTETARCGEHKFVIC